MILYMYVCMIYIYIYIYIIYIYIYILSQSDKGCEREPASTFIFWRKKKEKNLAAAQGGREFARPR